MTPVSGVREGVPAGEVTLPARRADCTVLEGGHLLFAFADPLAPATGTAGQPHLVCQHRQDTEERALLRVPVVSRRAVIPFTPVLLREGRWDLHVENAGPQEQRQRLAAGVLDRRHLLGPRPDVRIGAPVACWIPYATAYGNLSVRTWVRTRGHAEVTAVHTDDVGLQVSARLLGTAFAAAPQVLVSCRQQPAVVRRVAASAADDRTFAFRLRYAALADVPVDGDTEWDLWVSTGPMAKPVRIGRFLDEIHDKKEIFVYPEATVRTTSGGEARARPYYTADNELSVLVADGSPGRDST